MEYGKLMQSLFKKLYFWFYLLAIVNLTVGVFFRNEVIFVGSESSEVRIRLVLFQLLFAVALLIMAFFYHKVLIVDYFKKSKVGGFWVNGFSALYGILHFVFYINRNSILSMDLAAIEYCSVYIYAGCHYEYGSLHIEEIQVA
ncbi:MAG: hypothetical protein UZ09_BCD002000357 [Bacteroidetes bacterium OLB9]|nr:MAG: hypothetical protein UZ09_BCD002000357 [Bacteroidetes bacterium OLB9]